MALCLVVLVSTAALAQVTITWAEYPRPNQELLVQEIIASFEAKYPHIRVRYQPLTSADQITVAMASGVSPDIIGYWDMELIGWMQQGAFLPLNAYLEKYGFDWEDFNPMQLEAFAWQGEQYILPHYLGTTALFYNVDHFNEAGLPYPDETWTWEDRREVGRKLTLRQGDRTVRWGNMFPLTSVDRWANLISANGGKHHPEGDNSVVLWDSPEAIAAMEYWRSMVHDDRSAPTIAELINSDYRATFRSGLISMYETLPIDIAHFETADFKFAITQNPSGPVKRVSLATLDGFGVWAGTPHPEEAVLFLLHLVSPEVNAMRARLQSLQPARRSVLAEWVDIILESYPFVTREDVMQFMLAGQYAEPMPGFLNPAATKQALGRALARIYNNNEPPHVVMREEIPAINAQLAQFKASL